MTSQLVARLRRLRRHRRVAFVLSGGGNLGAVQVGMLRALVESGIRPDLIVGCSVGSINGAAFAAEPSIRGVNRLERIWQRMADGDPDIMPRGRIPVAVQIARKGQSLHSAEALRQLIDDELGATSFSELPIEFECVAANVDTGKEAWFGRGPLIPALMASAALPAVFPPVELDGSRFMDGGVVNELPLNRALELGATDIYVLQVGHLTEREFHINRPLDSLIHAYWMARLARLRDVVDNVGPECRVYNLPSGCTPRLRFDDFTQAEVLAEHSYEASRAYLRTGTAPDPVAGPFSGDNTVTGEPGRRDGPDYEGGGFDEDDEIIRGLFE